MAQVTIYLDPEAAKKARQAAKRAGKTLSGWIRELITGAEETRNWPETFPQLYGAISDQSFAAPHSLRADQVNSLEP
jgi:hypothetical protein